MTFKKGDVVELVAGSMLMTVAGVRTSIDVLCVWHNEKGDPHSTWYPFACLKAYDREAERERCFRQHQPKPGDE